MARGDVVTDQTVLVDRSREGIAVVSLHRPATLNSMSMQLVNELEATLDGLAAEEDCRVIVMTGTGRGFSSGHDLSEMDAEFTIHDGMRVQERFAGLILRVRSMPQPMIAAINGPAAGGGLALALACDTRVCSDAAVFNAAFVRIGLSGCDVGVSYLLPRTVGPTAAFEMMLTGRLIDATEAHRIGLVLDVVPEGTVVDAAIAIAERICANTPFGVRMTKQVMWANLDAPSLEAAMELENKTQVLSGFTNDAKEAMRAFIDGRAPEFRNC